MARAPRLRSRRLGTAVGVGVALSVLPLDPGSAGATAVTPNPPCSITIQIGPFTQYLVADPCPYPPTTTAPTAPPTPVPTTVPATTAATVASVTTSPPPAPAPVPLPPPAPSPTPPPPQVPPPRTATTSTTSTSTTTSTTTTATTTVPPVQPLRPPPPSLSVTAVWSPQRPVPGEMATVTIEVRNDGVWPVDDLVLTDDVSASTGLRSATTEAGPCTVAGRQARCALGGLAPGAVATVEVRVLIDREPAGRTLVHQISLSGGGGGAEALVAQQSVSALTERPPTQKLALLDLPGTTVTIVVFLSFAMAARKSASG